MIIFLKNSIKTTIFAVKLILNPMKAFFCLFFILFISVSFSQNQQTTLEEKKVLLKQQYGIYENDHRGLVIYFNDQSEISYPIQLSFNTLNEAFTAFFGGGIMKDLVVISVLQPQSVYPLYTGGTPMDMNQSIEKYIELFNQ